MLSDFDDRARGALDIWSNAEFDTQFDVWTDANRFRPLVDVTGMNLQHLEMGMENPLHFPIHLHIESTDQMRNGCDRIGQYPDLQYVSDHVVNYYLDAKTNKRPRIDTISARMRDKFVVYDRIILPEKTKRTHSRWAVSISLPRVILPAQQALISLTPREQQVLDALVMGNTAKEIAAALNLAPKTVEHRIAAIKQKYSAKNIQHLVGLAVSQRLC